VSDEGREGGSMLGNGLLPEESTSRSPSYPIFRNHFCVHLACDSR
jgi:hypothetical protein